MNSSQREPILISAGIAFVILLILGILASEVLGKSEELQSSIKRKEHILAQIGKTAVEYSYAAQRTRNIQSRLGQDNTPLLSYLENLCRQAKITNPALQVLRTTPNDYYEESAAEIRAKALTLKQVTTLLNLIENSPRYLRVKLFQVKTPYATPELLDITVNVSSYAKKPEKKQQPLPTKEKEK